MDTCKFTLNMHTDLYKQCIFCGHEMHTTSHKSISEATHTHTHTYRSQAEPGCMKLALIALPMKWWSLIWCSSSRRWGGDVSSWNAAQHDGGEHQHGRRWSFTHTVKGGGATVQACQPIKCTLCYCGSGTDRVTVHYICYLFIYSQKREKQHFENTDKLREVFIFMILEFCLCLCIEPCCLKVILILFLQ